MTAINILQQAGTLVENNWVPGYRFSAENEEADRLAKEAAKEANDLPEVNNSNVAYVSVASDANTLTL